MLSYVEDIVKASLWNKASADYCGKGLDGGLGGASGPADISHNILKALRRQGSHVKAVILECISLWWLLV